MTSIASPPAGTADAVRRVGLTAYLKGAFRELPIVRDANNGTLCGLAVGGRFGRGESAGLPRYVTRCPETGCRYVTNRPKAMPRYVTGL
jgi:hypothetical protein